MIYRREYGPNAQRLWTDPSVKIFLGLFTLGALLVFGYELEPMMTFRPVDAVIVGSDAAMVSLKGRRTHHEFQSDIFYRYEVAGTPYMGRKYSRIDLESSRSVSVLRASSQETGTRVRAWYNPLRPEEAVLSRELNVQVTVLTFLFVMILWAASSQKMLGAPADSQTPSTKPASIE